MSEKLFCPVHTRFELVPEVLDEPAVHYGPELKDDMVELIRARDNLAIFPVQGDCMEGAGIEDHGWVGVDFTHMPRPPKYGVGVYQDPCLCLPQPQGQTRPTVMIKAYSGKWGSLHTVGTKYANQWAGGEYRINVAIFAQKIYGVIFASWGRDGHLKWKMDTSDFPEELPTSPTIRGVNVGDPNMGIKQGMDLA